MYSLLNYIFFRDYHCLSSLSSPSPARTTTIRSPHACHQVLHDLPCQGQMTGDWWTRVFLLWGTATCSSKQTAGPGTSGSSGIPPMTAIPWGKGDREGRGFPGRRSPMCSTFGSADVMLVAMVTVLTLTSQNWSSPHPPQLPPGRESPPYWRKPARKDEVGGGGVCGQACLTFSSVLFCLRSSQHLPPSTQHYIVVLCLGLIIEILLIIVTIAVCNCLRKA